MNIFVNYQDSLTINNIAVGESGAWILTVWDSHQKVWRLNIHCDNSLVVDMAE